MSEFNRRKFLEGLRRRRRRRRWPAPRCGRPRAAQQWNNSAGEGRQAARAALEPLRAGRRGPVHGQRQEVHRQDRHRGARRQRRLGRRAAEGRGRGQHRRRPGHHPVDQRRRATSIPDKLLDVTDLADYLGKKYGGWYPAVRGLHAARRQELDRRCRWAPPASMMVYRESHGEGGRLRHLPEGHRRLPQDVQGAARPRARRAAWRSATPPATAAGRNWLVWAFGGKLVDKNNKVVIDSPETLKALEYAQGAVRDLHPRHAVVARPEQQQGLPRRPDLASPTTASRSTTRPRTRTDPKIKEMAADIQHATFPVGPVGQADRVAPVLQPDDLQVHEVPEGGQGVPALHDGAGAVRPVAAGARAATSRSRCAPTRRTRSGPSDPKNTPYRDAVKNMRPAGYAGKLGYASAGALADFIMRGHGGRGGQRLEDAEGSDGAGAEARRALLQGLSVAVTAPRGLRGGSRACRPALLAAPAEQPQRARAAVHAAGGGAAAACS